MGQIVVNLHQRERDAVLKYIPLILSFILCVIVTHLNLTDHSYFNGIIMSIVSVLVLIELIKQTTSKDSKSS